MTRDFGNLQRKPFLTPIWLTMLAILLGMIFLAAATWVWGTADTTTVVVVRQAEDDADLPPTAAGEARARALSHLFGDAGAVGQIDAIYISPRAQSRMTAAPLAKRLGLAPIVVPADDTRSLARRVLHEHSGGRVMIVARREALTAMVETLSGTPPLPTVGEQDYGTIYVVSVPRIGRANLLRLNY